jgi:hypothetical protein
MKLFKFLLVLGVTLFAGGQVFAQTVGIGTTKGGATGQVSASIAKVVSQHAGFQMRTHPMAGTQKYIPAVNAGSLEFGVANIMQTTWSVNGEVLSKGHANKNLRMVATLMQFRVGPIVAADSGIKAVSDLKGKRIPSEFKAAPLFAQIMKGFLANANLSYDDVKKVPLSGLRQHWDQLSERKIDAAIAAAGSGYINLVSKKLGGIRYLSLDSSPKALARLQNFVPGVTLKAVNPKKGLTGINKPTSLMHYDYTLFAGKDVSADVVYKVTKALYENPGDLQSSSPLWKAFKSGDMPKDQGITYHPGAIKYYKEKGVWKR